MLKNTITGCTCGLCCHKSYPCDKCLENTLNANGIPLGEIKKFKGLSNKKSGYEWPWEYSELCLAIKEKNKKEKGE